MVRGEEVRDFPTSHRPGKDAFHSRPINPWRFVFPMCDDGSFEDPGLPDFVPGCSLAVRSYWDDVKVVLIAFVVRRASSRPLILLNCPYIAAHSLKPT